MSEQQDPKELPPLDEVSEDLDRGLRACHSIIDDYRHKLAASSHDLAANDGGRTATDDSATSGG